jgi:hypothetical protein
VLHLALQARAEPPPTAADLRSPAGAWAPASSGAWFQAIGGFSAKPARSPALQGAVSRPCTGHAGPLMCQGRTWLMTKSVGPGTLRSRSLSWWYPMRRLPAWWSLSRSLPSRAARVSARRTAFASDTSIKWLVSVAEQYPDTSDRGQFRFLWKIALSPRGQFTLFLRSWLWEARLRWVCPGRPTGLRRAVPRTEPTR